MKEGRGDRWGFQINEGGILRRGAALALEESRNGHEAQAKKKVPYVEPSFDFLCGLEFVI
jgi:hypothetical protein